MHTKIANLVKDKPLYLEEIGVIIGCLLGDGTLSTSGKEYRLRIEHTQKHEKYVLWKYSLLRRLTACKPQVVRKHNSIRFGTVGHPQLTTLRKKWYKDGKKVISKELKDLSDLSLAIWFMDNGTKHRDTVDFSTHSFKKSNLKILQNLLKSKGIETTINYDSKGNRLYVVKKSYSAFKKLVKPYIVECMAYKLP